MRIFAAVEKLKDIKAVVFDADDTLWDCQTFFDDVEREYCRLLAPFAPAAEVSAALFRTEEANMPLLGYGCKAFVLSLIESAVSLSGGRVDGRAIGELLDQQNKLRRSRLEKYFQHVEIVSDKTERAFLSLCRRLRLAPGSVLMVGNSLKSDAAPALAAGAWAAHIPFHATWQLERTADFDHPRLLRLGSFGELPGLLRD